MQRSTKTVPRWFQNWGWIAVLTLIIFMGYCTFYLVYDHNSKVTEKLTSPSYDNSFRFSQVPLASIGAKALSIDDAEMSQDEPAPEEFPSTEILQDEPFPDDSPPLEPIQSELLDALPAESAAMPDETGTEVENTGTEIITTYSESVAAYSEDGETDYIGNDEIAILIGIYKQLQIIIAIISVVIAAFIVYIIIRPLKYFTS